MSALRQLQQRFVSAVLQRDASVLHGMLAADPARAAARVHVYINHHHIGLREALAAIYPVLRRVLGPECFDLLARNYVDCHPKSSGNLHDFGASLANFIHATPALGLPYLCDLARLEWARHQVSFAADSVAEHRLSLSRLAALDDAALADLHLRLVPAAQLFQSPFPILQIWQSNQHAEPRLVALDEAEVKCVVLRAGLEVRFEALSAAQFTFLAALDQHSVCVAAEAALHMDPHFDLAITLARGLSWLQHETARSKP